MNRIIEKHQVQQLKPQIYLFQDKLSQILSGKCEPLTFKGAQLLNAGAETAYGIKTWNLLKQYAKNTTEETETPFLFTRDINNYLENGMRVLGRLRPTLTIAQMEAAIKTAIHFMPKRQNIFAQTKKGRQLCFHLTGNTQAMRPQHSISPKPTTVFVKFDPESNVNHASFFMGFYQEPDAKTGECLKEKAWVFFDKKKHLVELSQIHKGKMFDPLALYYKERLHMTEHEFEISTCPSVEANDVPHTAIHKAINCGKTVYCHAEETGTQRIFTDIVREGFSLHDFLIFAGDSRKYVFSLTPNPAYK
jgi:hypothetical protein